MPALRHEVYKVLDGRLEVVDCILLARWNGYQKILPAALQVAAAAHRAGNMNLARDTGGQLHQH